jgi:uncharacterized phage-associated protein
VASVFDGVATANIFDVAKYILEKCGEMPARKLHILCYYAQALNLALEGFPLFNEDFVHWDEGPVCRDLFKLHKGLYNVDAELVKKYMLSEEGVTDDEQRNIDRILERYKSLSGVELSTLTHAEDPWKNTKKNQVIEKDVMEKYYSDVKDFVKEEYNDPYFKSQEFYDDLDKIIEEVKKDEENGELICVDSFDTIEELNEKLGI